MSEATKHIQSQIDEASKEAAQYIQSEYEADTPEEKKLASDNYGKALDKITKLETLLSNTKNEEAQPTPDMTVDTLQMQMEAAAEAGNKSEYKRLREQRADLIKRFGRGASVSSSKAYQADHPALSGNRPDLLAKMQAAAEAGDMTMYKELRKRRNEAMAG